MHCNRMRLQEPADILYYCLSGVHQSTTQCKFCELVMYDTSTWPAPCQALCKLQLEEHVTKTSAYTHCNASP